MRQRLDRRSFLRLGGVALATAGAAFPAPFVLAQQHARIRIISNNGAENDSLEQLLRDRGFLEQTGIDVEFVKVNGPAVNLAGLLDGRADFCAISGFNPMPDIAEGAAARIVGSAMKLTALSIFSRDPAIRSVKDLAGRSVGIGPRNFLLHATTIALLRKNGVDEKSVHFVEIGSNAQVFQAVAAGKVDAGPSSVVSFYYQDKLGVHSLDGGNMWATLPEYTYQMMYASQRAIRDKRSEIVLGLAAYAKLFRFLQSSGSWDAYLAARAKALPKNDAEEASAVWKFMQEQKPYGETLEIPADRLRYMQELNVSLGAASKVMPADQIADMSMARDAMKLLG